MRLAILLPTRARPHNVKRLLDSIHATAPGAELAVRAYVDEDDQVTLTAIPELQQHPVDFQATVGSRMILAAYWNELWKQHRSDFDVFQLMGDDVVFRTQGWFHRVMDYFADDPMQIVGCYDGFRKAGDILTLPFVSKQWTEALGYFVPPYFPVWWVDTWLTEQAQALNRKVWLPDILIEHLNAELGKAPMDETAEHLMGLRQAANKIWDATLPERLRDIDRLWKRLESK